MKLFNLGIALFIGTVFSLNAQETKLDQMFLIKGETLAVSIKKVEPKKITYSFVGEDLENVVEKTNVAKIIFKYGREQVFSDTIS